MARLSVREYEHIANAAEGAVLVGVEPAIAKYQIPISGDSAMGQQFNERTRFVRLQADVACSIDIDILPSAVSGEGSLPAGATEYFGVQNGKLHRIAVIAE